ncbi:hypothetical protein MINTMi198_32110 [Mycobacterium intracellulare M.i.198]|nr:hypothetical protein MINTMi198_32110 [Mycobacterium intracellulare M.i.198]
MKFALASYGTRGDIEPSAAVGRELVRRGHDVRLAVPPELVAFVESTGLVAVPYGPKVQEFLDEEFLRNMWADFFRNPIRQLPKVWDPIIKYWPDVSTTLKSLADGADLLTTGLNFEQAAANVAEYYDIPLASLHHFPMRANGRLVPSMPAPLVRSTMTAIEWLFWRSTKKVDNAQRQELGLPKATHRSQRRIADHGWLEIQTYDDVFFPAWPPNGRNGVAAVRSSAHSPWSWRPTPTTMSPRGSPREHHPSASGPGAYRSNPPPPPSK